MALVKYNFQSLYDAIDELTEYANDPKSKNKIAYACEEIKRELNKFYRDSTCTEILFTINTDKLFFGCCVFPNIDDSDVYRFIEPGTEKIRITSYCIEFDSKLFDPRLALTSKEITAILLHEIGHLVNDSRPAEELRMNFANFCNTEKINVYETKNKHYLTILKVGIRDALRKMYSMFNKKDDEIIADEFVIAYGHGPELESALHKITRNHRMLNQDVKDSDFTVLAWTLRLYIDIKHKRIPALRTINKMKDMTSSSIEKKDYISMRTALTHIDDDDIIQEGFILDGIHKMQRKGIRGYEEDYYEYLLQAKNIQYEEDAIALVHKINSRMAIIDDYIYSNADDMEPSEKKKWNNLYDKYDKLRVLIGNKTLVKDRYKRLYINYPDGTTN